MSWYWMCVREGLSDYACGIKVDGEFETTVYELRAYFGFFKLAHACESDFIHMMGPRII
jgi:hypothetical protein